MPLLIAYKVIDAILDKLKFEAKKISARHSRETDSYNVSFIAPLGKQLALDYAAEVTFLYEKTSGKKGDYKECDTYKGAEYEGMTFIKPFVTVMTVDEAIEIQKKMYPIPDEKSAEENRLAEYLNSKRTAETFGFND